jgi:hypothetical protein
LKINHKSGPVISAGTVKMIHPLALPWWQMGSSLQAMAFTVCLSDRCVSIWEMPIHIRSFLFSSHTLVACLVHTYLRA